MHIFRSHKMWRFPGRPNSEVWHLNWVDIVVSPSKAIPTPNPTPREHTYIWEADAPWGHISQLPWTSYSLWQVLSYRILATLPPPHSYPFLRLDAKDNLAFRDGKPSEGRSVDPCLSAWREATTDWETYILDRNMSEKLSFIVFETLYIFRSFLSFFLFFFQQ